MKYILLVFCLFLSTKVLAGTEGGNGGDVLVCPDRIELLDFYEAQLRNDEIIQVDGSDEWTVAAKILDRLTESNPTRKRIFLEGLKNFPTEIKFVRDEELVDIPDQGDIPIPRNCELKQIAIHSNPLIKDDYSSWDRFQPNRYKIDKNLWDQLSVQHKAGLITHELILREAVHTLGHKDTKNVRRINSYIWSQRLPKTNSPMYINILKTFGFKYTDLTFGDFTLFTDESARYLQYGDAGPYFRLEPYKNSYVIFRDTLLKATHIGMNFYKAVTEINLLPDSQPYKIDRVGEFVGLIKFRNGFISATTAKTLYFIIQGKVLHIADDIIIDSKGNLIEGTLKKPVDLQHLYYNLNLSAESRIRFTQNQSLSYATHASGAIRGFSNDYFLLDDAEISLDTIDNRLLNIKGEFIGYVTPLCQGQEPLQVNQRFEYKGELTAVTNILEPRRCVSKDGSEFLLQNFFQYSGCSVVSSLEVPDKFLPCRWIP